MLTLRNVLNSPADERPAFDPVLARNKIDRNLVAQELRGNFVFEHCKQAKEVKRRLKVLGAWVKDEIVTLSEYETRWQDLNQKSEVLLKEHTYKSTHVYANTKEKSSLLSMLKNGGNDFKQDWLNIDSLLKSTNVNVLYHFTDKANLPFIIKHGGLLSKKRIENNNIQIPRPGGTADSWELDRNRNLFHYISLAYSKKPPMYHIVIKEGRIQQPVWLLVSIEVMYLQSTWYSTLNATDSHTVFSDKYQGLLQTDFSIAVGYEYDEDKMKRKKAQAEVLVQKCVPAKYILNWDEICRLGRSN